VVFEAKIASGVFPGVSSGVFPSVLPEPPALCSANVSVTNPFCAHSTGAKGCSRLPYDHKHRHVSDQGVPYGFRDAHQLLADFFNEVDRVLLEIKKS